MIKVFSAVAALSILLLTSCGGDKAEEITTSASPSESDTEELSLVAAAGGKIGWGLGKECDENNRPRDAEKADEKYAEYNAHFIGDEDKKVIYLTFDEGYENGYTESILDTLKSHNALATFFITGDYAKAEPELVRRMIDEGHSVGNHSWSHPSFPDCTAAEVREEITKLHNYVADEFGYEMKVIRFPRGEFDEESLSVAHELGYTSLFWSFAYLDFDVNAQPERSEAFSRITDATHNGAVYLLHAVSQTNAEVLDQLLNFWTGNGYKMGKYG